MTQDQKRNIQSWMLKTKYTAQKGGKISVKSIIDSVYKNWHKTDDAMPEYLNNVHPFLFFNFVLDWEKVPVTYLPKGFSNGVEFGNDVIRKWRDECWKLKIFNYDNFSNFDTIDQLIEITDKILNGSISHEGGYEKLEEEIYFTRQAIIDEEQKRKAEELERLEEKRLAEIEEGKIKEAQRLADEERRLKKEQEAKERAAANKEFLNKPSSPWSSGVVTTPSKPTIEDVAVVKTTKKKAVKDLTNKVYTGMTTKADDVWGELRGQVSELAGLLDGKKIDVHIYFNNKSNNIDFILSNEHNTETITGNGFAEIMLKFATRIQAIRKDVFAAIEERQRQREALEAQIKELQEKLNNL